MRSPFRTVTPLLVALATCPAPVLAKKTAPLVFRGNLVLGDDVYLTMLDLPPDFVADQAGADRVRARLLDYLRRAGYEIARVDVTPKAGRLLVEIDEGRVEKVVLRGQGSIRTVQMLLALSLPHDVFNRPYLEKQLAAIRARTGIEVERFELVSAQYDAGHPAPEAKRPGTKRDDLGHVVGDLLIPPRTDYELHILFKRREWQTGFGVTAALSNADGLRLGVDYRGDRAIFARDRWLAGIQLGGKLRSRVSDGSSYAALQRAGAQLAWIAPSLAQGLRPELALKGELTSRQRPDIGLESYTFTSLQLTPGLRYDLPSGSVHVGLGIERRNTFGLKPVEDADVPPEIQSSTMLVPYADASVRLVFDPDEIRRDRHHELELGARHTIGNTDTKFGVASYGYRKVFGLGWHDLQLSSRGAYLFGDPPFMEEQTVGGAHLRGVYGDLFYARRVVSAGVESRFSLLRDIYKVGVFAQCALFGEIDRAADRDRASVAAAFGPGFHVLVAYAFQLDLYYAVGVASHARIDHGFAANLRQAF